jgi:hypothetical protein
MQVGQPLLWAPVLLRVQTFRDPPYLVVSGSEQIRPNKRGTVAVALWVT